MKLLQKYRTKTGGKIKSGVLKFLLPMKWTSRSMYIMLLLGLSGDDIICNRVLEALYRRTKRAYNGMRCFRCIIVIPLLPGFQGGLDDGGAASVRAIMHWQYRNISRGQNSILHNLYYLLELKTHDYISFYGFRAYGMLFDGGPVACRQVYVHSKIMIIHDTSILIRSANINDRSLLLDQEILRCSGHSSSRYGGHSACLFV